MGKGVCLVLVTIPIYTSSPLPAASEYLSLGTRESGSVGLEIIPHWNHLCKMWTSP